VGAEEVVARLTGMCLLVVATVTAEEFAVTAHGRAVPLDVQAPEARGFRETLSEIYGPRYGEQDWERSLEGGDDPANSPVYMRIEAERMFTFAMQ
jgi:hypothetical protein